MARKRASSFTGINPKAPDFAPMFDFSSRIELINFPEICSARQDFNWPKKIFAGSCQPFIGRQVLFTLLDAVFVFSKINRKRGNIVVSLLPFQARLKCFYCFFISRRWIKGGKEAKSMTNFRSRQNPIINIYFSDGAEE